MTNIINQMENGTIIITFNNDFNITLTESQMQLLLSYLNQTVDSMIEFRNNFRISCKRLN